MSELTLKSRRVLLPGGFQPAAVTIRDGRIAAIGRITARGRTEIDARGKVVAPGFIDVHAHAEDVTALPAGENFLRMGVTTIVTGNCGGSKLNVAEFFSDDRRGMEQFYAIVQHRRLPQ